MILTVGGRAAKLVAPLFAPSAKEPSVRRSYSLAHGVELHDDAFVFCTRSGTSIASRLAHDFAKVRDFVSRAIGAD